MLYVMFVRMTYRITMFKLAMGFPSSPAANSLEWQYDGTIPSALDAAPGSLKDDTMHWNQIVYNQIAHFTVDRYAETVVVSFNRGPARVFAGWRPSSRVHDVANHRYEHPSWYKYKLVTTTQQPDEYERTNEGQHMLMATPDHTHIIMEYHGWAGYGQQMLPTHNGGHSRFSDYNLCQGKIKCRYLTPETAMLSLEELIEMKKCTPYDGTGTCKKRTAASPSSAWPAGRTASTRSRSPS